MPILRIRSQCNRIRLLGSGLIARRARSPRGRWRTGRRSGIDRSGWRRAPVFEPPEHDLDTVSAFVAALVVTDSLGPGFPTRDAGRDALGLQGVSEPICVIAPVAQQPLRLRQAVQQGGSAGVVADLARCHEQADRASIRVGHSVQLGVQAAFGASDQPPETPFFTPRLEAVRCALR